MRQKPWFLWLTFAVSILVCLLIVLLSATRSRVQIRIGHLQIASHLPVYVAIEKGFFQEEGVDVERYPFSSSNELRDALLANRLDIGYELGTDVVLNVAKQDPNLLRVYQIAVSQKSVAHDAIIVRDDSPVRSLEALKGKKLGVFPGPTAVAFMRIVLGRMNMEEGRDYNLVQLPPQAQLAALWAGQVDALFTYEPTVSEALLKGRKEAKGRLLIRGPVEDVINPWPGGCGVFTTTFMRRTPEAAEKARRALYKAFDFIHQHRKEALECLQKHFRLDWEVANEFPLTDHWTVYLSAEERTSGKAPTVDHSQFTLYIKLLQDSKVLQGEVDPLRLFYEPHR